MPATIMTRPSEVVVSYRELVSPELFDRLVGRIIKDEDVTRPVAEQIMEGALGFLKLCADHPGKGFAPSKLVDIGWHTFILYTRSYDEFCDQIAGRFLHHEPNDNPSVTVPVGGVMRTVEFMQAHGVPYNELVWVGQPSDAKILRVLASECRSEDGGGGPGGTDPSCTVDCDDGDCHAS
jgi:hypothetical protein